jgi:uncharacterized protein YjgD (DUF1641 family)
MNQIAGAPEIAASEPAVSDLAGLNHKLDVLTAQVQALTEQARLASRRQEERAELAHDVIPILDDAFRIVTEQLEEVQDYVDLSDLLRLLKRLLRNARTFETLLDQLESLTDLAQTVGPLSNSAFEKATDLLQAAEQKGYFALAKDGAHVVDTLVGEMTLARPVDSSLRSLLRQSRDPDVRRGLAFSMRILAVVGAEVARRQQAGTSPNT